MNVILNFLQDSALARLLDGSRYISMTIQVFHILAFTLLLALVLAYNIRVLRLSLRGVSLHQLARAFHTPYRLALGVALLAGFLLFLPRTVAYSNNDPFVLKMALLLLAGLVQFLLLRRFSGNTADAEASLPVRAASVLSLLLWFSTGVAGRAIGFV